MTSDQKTTLTVLFQGDSITDAGRDRGDYYDLGQGYAFMAAAWFQAAFPQVNITFLNRGISGNRVRDLKVRWEKDCIALQPDLVSILIGINDCWRRYDQNDPTSLESFYQDYRTIISQTLDQTKAKVILLEPFVLPVPQDRQAWREDLNPKIAAVNRLADEFSLELIRLDQLFTEKLEFKPAAFWAEDGVHPSPPGHALIAQAWLKTAGEYLRKR